MKRPENAPKTVYGKSQHIFNTKHILTIYLLLTTDTSLNGNCDAINAANALNLQILTTMLWLVPHWFYFGCYGDKVPQPSNQYAKHETSSRSSKHTRFSSCRGCASVRAWIRVSSHLHLCALTQSVRLGKDNFIAGLFPHTWIPSELWIDEIIWRMWNLCKRLTLISGSGEAFLSKLLVLKFLLTRFG